MNVVLPAVKTPEPIAVAPSKNVTIPVGVPIAGATALTVTENETACPALDGLTDEFNANCRVGAIHNLIKDAGTARREIQVAAI